MSEKHTKRLMELAVTSAEPSARLFPNVVGQGWVGASKRITTPGNYYCKPGDVIVSNARPLQAGLHTGSPDHVGWNSVVVTPEMVGTRVGIMCGLEAKYGRNGASKEQRNFIRAMQEAGCRAGIYRTPEEALAILRGTIKQQ